MNKLDTDFANRVNASRERFASEMETKFAKPFGSIFQLEREGNETDERTENNTESGEWFVGGLGI